ncbi:hypothetical protein D9619_007705 [Psilocybe cf. subviscida]|uniref:Uncharacterized protein n=1 Tax=Psilocybe cf. subviscida TaxID=2480587 RepID=A0A8H5ESD4_9AGAR|nr:hypothetical protein D9619_007705 [Psilocybe cf. subviscida]
MPYTGRISERLDSEPTTVLDYGAVDTEVSLIQEDNGCDKRADEVLLLQTRGTISAGYRRHPFHRQSTRKLTIPGQLSTVVSDSVICENQGRIDTEERKPTLGEELIAGNERRSARAKHSSETSVASARCIRVDKTTILDPSAVQPKADFRRDFTHPSPTPIIDPANNIVKIYVVDHQIPTVVVKQVNDEWADDASSFQTDRE